MNRIDEIREWATHCDKLVAISERSESFEKRALEHVHYLLSEIDKLRADKEALLISDKLSKEESQHWASEYARLRESGPRRCVKCGDEIVDASQLCKKYGECVFEATTGGETKILLSTALDRIVEVAHAGATQSKEPDSIERFNWIIERATGSDGGAEREPIDVSRQHDFIQIVGSDRCGLRGCVLGVIEHSWIPPLPPSPVAEHPLADPGLCTEDNGGQCERCVNAVAEAQEPVEYREGDLEKFFGIDPDFTGDKSTSEYVDSVRGGPDAAPTDDNAEGESLPCEPCPFKVGDRVRNKHSSWAAATVTEVTERGFRYQYDKPVVISPRLGSATGGEAYREGFESWEIVARASSSTATAEQTVRSHCALCEDPNFIYADCVDAARRAGVAAAWERAIYLATAEAFERRSADCVVSALESARAALQSSVGRVSPDPEKLAREIVERWLDTGQLFNVTPLVAAIASAIRAVADQAAETPAIMRRIDHYMNSDLRYRAVRSVLSDLKDDILKRRHLAGDQPSGVDTDGGEE